MDTYFKDPKNTYIRRIYNPTTIFNLQNTLHIS